MRRLPRLPLSTLAPSTLTRRTVATASMVAVTVSTATALTLSPAGANDLPEPAGSAASSGPSVSSVSSVSSGPSGTADGVELTSGSHKAAGMPTVDHFLPGPSPYSTDTRNNLVAFGDSFTANPHELATMLPPLAVFYPKPYGCFVAPDAWPALAGAAADRPVQNWACNGHTTEQMLTRIDKAIAAGHVNNTSTVVLAAGMNDKRQYVPDARVVANLVAGVAKVKNTAPDARVIILGRLPTTDVNRIACTLNVIPDQPLGLPDFATAAAEDATQQNQRHAATTAGVTFIDVRGLTRSGHSSCAKDADRYVSGVVDTTTPSYNIQSHPTIAGSRFLASQIGTRLGADSPGTA